MSYERPPGWVRLRVAPCTIAEALRYVSALHRHLPRLNGGLFACSIEDELGQVRGVGVFGHPPRAWQGTGAGAILRVATDGVPNGCTMIMGALCRAAAALGYDRVYTWTLPEEGGASLRAAGFALDGQTKGGEWSCPSRPRPPAQRADPKLRWVRYLT